MNEKPGFEKPKCAECGTILEQRRASYESHRNFQDRYYCSKCAPLARLKETWQPMVTGGSIAGIYTLDENGKIVPQRR